MVGLELLLSLGPVVGGTTGVVELLEEEAQLDDGGRVEEAPGDEIPEDEFVGEVTNVVVVVPVGGGAAVGGGDRITTLVVVTVAVAQVDDDASSHFVTTVVVVSVLCQDVLDQDFLVVGYAAVVLAGAVVFVPAVGVHPRMGGLGRTPTQTS